MGGGCSLWGCGHFSCAIITHCRHKQKASKLTQEGEMYRSADIINSNSMVFLKIIVIVFLNAPETGRNSVG